MAVGRSHVASPRDLDQTLGLDEANNSPTEGGTVLLPPSPAIAFRTLPHTRTPITVCALRSVGKAHALRRQTERDQDDQRRTPRALAPPAALCSSFVRQQLTTRALDFSGFWLLRESVKKIFAAASRRVSSHWLVCHAAACRAADRVVLLSVRRYLLQHAMSSSRSSEASILRDPGCA